MQPSPTPPAPGTEPPPVVVPAPPGAPPPGWSERARFGVRCPSCARTQPAGWGAHTCRYCGASLRLPRWRAVPPPGAEPPPVVVPAPPRPTPRYWPYHPTWGFPPVAGEDPADRPAVPPPPVPAGRLAALAIGAGLVGLLALAAAAAEIWRYRLALAGRTVVLDPAPVRVNGIAVTATAGVLLVVTAVVGALALAAAPRAYAAAVARAGQVPARTPRQIVARLLVPGWNLWGVGQVLYEIAAPTRAFDLRRRSWRWAVPLAWLGWIASELLAVAAVATWFADSNQWRANGIVLHAATDLVAAVAAIGFAVTAVSLRAALLGRGRRRYRGWEIVPPSVAGAG